MPRRRSRTKPAPILGSPFLTRVALKPGSSGAGTYPFTLPLLSPDFELLLEALAWRLGFGAQGGSRDNSFAEGADGHALGSALHLEWRQRVSDGFFLRAETFFNFASYLESVNSTFLAYGGTSPHEQSHGEAFLALFEHRFEDGVYLLDEPEAALSPQRQLAFLRILQRLTVPKVAQFIIATHSPMLLTFPGATLFSLDGGAVRRVTYEQTEHYQLTRDFLNAPQRFYQHLFAPEDSDTDPEASD